MELAALRNNLHETRKDEIEALVGQLRQQNPSASEELLVRAAVSQTLESCGTEVKSFPHSVTYGGGGRITRPFFLDADIHPRMFVIQIMVIAHFPIGVIQAFLVEVDGSNEVRYLRKYSIRSLEQIYGVDSISRMVRDVKRKEIKDNVFYYLFVGIVIIGFFIFYRYFAP